MAEKQTPQSELDKQLDKHQTDGFEDILAMQRDQDDQEFRTSIAAAQRLTIQQAPSQEENIPVSGGEQINKDTSSFRRGATRAAVALTAGAVGIGALVANELSPETPSGSIAVVVMPGDGLQKLIEENVPQVASGGMDWREVADTIKSLPENSDLAQPGYVLKPGDTISIPVYESQD